MQKPTVFQYVLLFLSVGCSGTASKPRVSYPNPSRLTSPITFVGAGDIAKCASDGDEATARLLDGFPTAVIFTVGDNVYPKGTSAEFRDCYTPSWGRYKERIRPALGNHDYLTRRGRDYYRYFGAHAGLAGKGYYSYDLGDWHVAVLNSNLAMGAGSTQERWLRADLKANPRTCTLAYWHEPRFSSGPHGNAIKAQAIWQALYDAGADIVIGAHDHTYERFARQTPTGLADSIRGIREFVVGTGGASHYGLRVRQANSEIFDSTTFGVLKLTLSSTSYAWEFVPVAGGIFRDAGGEPCH